MYTLLETISPLSKIILLGSDPNLSDISFKLFSEIEITKDLQSPILENAQRNGLIPILYQNLKKHPSVSDAFINQLKQLVLKGSMLQLKQEAVFRDIHQTLSENRIDFRILKGFYLAKTVYPEVLMRPMVDIDIMIQPALIDQVFKILISKGYESYPISEHKLISNYKHHPYGLKFKGVAIELHKSIFSDYDKIRIDDVLLWDNAVEFSFSGLISKTFNHEVFLFHLSHHLMGHLRGDFIKLIWCRDIAEFIKVFNNKIDWDYFLHLYKFSGASETLLHGLWFVDDWMNAKAPKKVLNKINANKKEIAADFIWFTEHARNDKPRPHLITKFNQVGGLSNKLIFLTAKLFPDPNYLLQKNHKKNSLHLIILYPKHLIKFIARGINALFPSSKK